MEWEKNGFLFEGIWKGVWGKVEIRDSLVGLGTTNQLRDLRDSTFW